MGTPSDAVRNRFNTCSFDVLPVVPLPVRTTPEATHWSAVASPDAILPMQQPNQWTRWPLFLRDL